MWIWLFIALTVVAAGCSIYGSLDTRRDFKTGQPSYASVVDYTGIGSPDELERLLGSPDENQRFAISPGDAAKLPRRAWVGLLDSIVGDCLAGALSVAGGIVARHSPVWGWGLVLTAAAYLTFGYCLAVWVVLRHPRLRE